MAAIAFDTLKAARRLIAAGVPATQAEAQAEVMAEAFVFNVDKLVTQDYLDARFTEHEARLDVLKAEMNGKFRLVFWMLAVVIVTTVIPQLQSLFAS